MPRKSFPFGVIVLAALVTLSACARVVTVQTPGSETATGSMNTANSENVWWSIVFRMRWDPEQTPDWYMDALLADQVCAPALADFDPQITLWRFHRRAADDIAGHQLNLLVYTDPLTADALYSRIRASSILQWLETDGRIVAVAKSQVERPELSPVARTSDADWPPEIQASWPWFIMGVSQTWLSLIQQVTAREPFDDPSPSALPNYYQTVNEQVTALWRVYGQHAYLHHLNALFGYEPLIIQETNLKRF